jgi:PAS domain S-box-containing protein
VNDPSTSDPRLRRIQELLIAINAGDYSQRGEISDKGDEIDAIILAINTLSEEQQSSGKIIRDYEKRITAIMDVLLKHTVMDFSEKMEVSPAGDELDAIALGLNTLGEELESRITSERKYTQELEKLAIILETTADAVTTTSADMIFQSWNNGAEQIYGYTADEIIGKKKPEDFVAPEDKEDLKAVYEHALAGQRVSDFHTRAIRKDGTVIDVSVTITPIADEDGKVELISGISRDITEQKKAEAALRESDERHRHLAEKVESLNHQLEKNILQLEDSNSELEAFTYSVSHDLRAPLRAIHGYTKVLSKDYSSQLDEEAKQMMDAVIANAKKMGQLIDDLLALSRLGRKDLQRRPLDMTNVVQAVINDLKKNTETTAEIILNPLPQADADFGLITQVFTNLISNAVKYSAKNAKPVVEIGSEKIKSETIFYVKDNGAGFDMQYYNKLFGVFQRLHDAGEFEGTGVGLAIVKRIIQKHNGRIWAEAEIDKGAKFFFTLGMTEHEKPKL